MSGPSQSPRRVAVIGGGITGLAAAHRLTELAPQVEVRLFEASGRLGGVLETVRDGDWLYEKSADNFIADVPWALDLCRRVGLGDELLNTNQHDRRAMVVCRGHLEPIPAGFTIMAPARLAPLLRSPILSWPGKLRLLAERMIPCRGGDADESVAEFATRRLGRETYDRLVQPLVGGIYTADCRTLSIAAGLPRYRDMEREHGSLTRGAKMKHYQAATHKKSDSAARYSMFLAPRAGMSSLVEAIARRLPAETVRLNASIERLERVAGGWRIGDESFDAVIVATSAPIAARLLAQETTLAGRLRMITSASSAVVVAVYDERQLQRPLGGFGFVVPEIERRPLLAASYASNKFPGRSASGQVVIRAFVGGALHPELASAGDEELRAVVTSELGPLVGIDGSPRAMHIVRWPHAMPQYQVGHLDLVRHIDESVATLPGLHLAGSAYHGVGIPHCIHSGEQAAERVLGRSESTR